MGDDSPISSKRGLRLVLTKKNIAVWCGILGGIGTFSVSAWTIAYPYIGVPDRISAVESKQAGSDKTLADINDTVSRIDERQKARLADEKKMQDQVAQLQQDMAILLQREQAKP